jgi:hypothetical protein
MSSMSKGFIAAFILPEAVYSCLWVLVIIIPSKDGSGMAWLPTLEL